MAIRYEPKKLLAKMAPDGTIEKLVTRKAGVNKIIVRSLARTGILSPKELESIALKVAKDYKARIAEEIADGATPADAFDDGTNGQRLLINRVQNATVAEVTKRVQEKYDGERYVWLPSTAATPRAEHVRKYGKKYRLGRGEKPGDAYGCQCGMKILVDETRLVLGE